MPHRFAMVDGPLHDLHAAQAAAGDRRPLPDPQSFTQAALAVDPVADRYDGKVRAEADAGFRIEAVGPGAALATAEIVERHHENFRVSKGLPGPMHTSHQPGLRSSGA